MRFVLFLMLICFVGCESTPYYQGRVLGMKDTNPTIFPDAAATRQDGRAVEVLYGLTETGKVVLPYVVGTDAPVERWKQWTIDGKLVGYEHQIRSRKKPDFESIANSVLKTFQNEHGVMERKTDSELLLYVDDTIVVMVLRSDEGDVRVRVHELSFAIEQSPSLEKQDVIKPFLARKRAK